MVFPKFCTTFTAPSLVGFDYVQRPSANSSGAYSVTIQADNGLTEFIDVAGRPQMKTLPGSQMVGISRFVLSSNGDTPGDAAPPDGSKNIVWDVLVSMSDRPALTKKLTGVIEGWIRTLGMDEWEEDEKSEFGDLIQNELPEFAVPVLSDILGEASELSPYGGLILLSELGLLPVGRLKMDVLERSDDLPKVRDMNKDDEDVDSILQRLKDKYELFFYEFRGCKPSQDMMDGLEVWAGDKDMEFLEALYKVSHLNLTPFARLLRLEGFIEQ